MKLFKYHSLIYSIKFYGKKYFKEIFHVLEAYLILTLS